MFNSPSAWAIHCKKMVNPFKKSGCGWASVSVCACVHVRVHSWQLVTRTRCDRESRYFLGLHLKIDN